MSDVPKGFIKRFFWLGAFALVAGMSYTGSNIYNKNQLDRMEMKVQSKFKTIQTYKNAVYLPSIKVAAPSGGIVDLKDNDGKYTVLNVWATWCAPCVRELESLRRLSKSFSYDSKWRIVAVSIDSKKNFPKVAAYTERYHVEKIANYLDYNADLQNHFNIEKLPMTLIVNPSGRIIYKIHGDVFWHDKAITDFMELITKVY
ncbi:MAG: hypothetical protein COB14_02440 [Alphaproteobacteria bacterium]|nr:MAG: hypothetical protein COB14_02440 [Alphaproteobacteria bacterium]